MAKIIPLRIVIETPSFPPLTPLMIKTLRLACEWQNRKEPFGQSDLNGSFMALVKREYIACKNITVEGEIEVSWFVTKAGITALGKIGIKEEC